MSRKIAVIAIAIAMAMVFVASFAIAGDPPGQVTIDKGADKQPGVQFNHETHAPLADCVSCHHTSKSKDDIQSCFECHGKDASAPVVKDAFHDQCIKCHKEQAKGPTKCKECHQK